MRKQPQTDPEQLCFRAGGGWAPFVLGTPLLLAGIGGVLFSLYGWLHIDPKNVKGWAVLGGAAALFGLFGALFLTARAALVLDRRTRAIERWKSVLVRFGYRRREWSEFTEVQNSRFKHTGKHGPFFIFGLHLRGPAGDMEIQITRDETEARQNAEALAVFMQLPLVEWSDSFVNRRAPGELNQPLLEQLRRGNLQAPVLTAPATLRSTVSASAGALRIHVPGPGLRGWVVVVIIAVFLLPMPVLAALNPPANATIAGQIGFFLMVSVLTFGLPVSVLVLHMLAEYVRSWEIEAGPAAIRVRLSGFLFSRTQEIPIAALEDLRLDETLDGLQLTAVSDTLFLRAGMGLAREELEYLRAAILRAIQA